MNDAPHLGTIHKKFMNTPFSSSSGCGIFPIETDSPEILTSEVRPLRKEQGENYV